MKSRDPRRGAVESPWPFIETHSDLMPAEREWLDRYHAWVLAEIGPMLDGEVLAWLEKATAPLA